MVITQKSMKENKITDLAVLFHALRANAVVCLWQNATNPTIEFPPLHENGWIPNEETYWFDDPFPVDLEHQLTVDYDNNECESEAESDDTHEEICWNRTCGFDFTS